MEMYRARKSFVDKQRGVETPPRLQVIGFNVSPKAEAPAPAPATKGSSLEIVSSCVITASFNEPSPPKPASSSPRSALQQLLLHQSLPSTSPPSSNHCLPHLLPPFISSVSSANHTFTAHNPAGSSPSSNQNLPTGPLQPASSPPPTASTIGGLLSPANQNRTSGISTVFQSPPSANNRSDSSSGQLLKSLLQSECASSDVPANHISSRTSILSSVGLSPCASSSSSSSSGNRMINLQTINSKPCEAPIKEKYEAFFQSKQTAYDLNVAKEVPEIKGRLISAKEVINEHPYAAKSTESSGLHDDDDRPSAEKCKKSSWKGPVQQITEHPLIGNEKSRKSGRSEEKTKKSSLFMFAASSPAPESHHHHQPAEHNTSLNVDFLSSCHLCRRFLGVGEDIFMYSGDKAFCSMECRYQQIVIDERKEKCPPPIIRSGASPVYQHTSVTATTTHHPIMIDKPHFINTAAAA